MISSDQASALRGSEMRGPDGSRIGAVGQVFLHGRTGAPQWATVRTGMFGMHESYVPHADATYDGEAVHVPYDKDMVKGAPTVSTEGSLSTDHQVELQAYYGVTDAPAAASSTPPSWDSPSAGGALEDDPVSPAYESDADRPATYEYADADTGAEDDPGGASASTSDEDGDAGRDDGAQDEDEKGDDDADAHAAADDEFIAAVAADDASSADPLASAPVVAPVAAAPSDDALVRSEEQLEVGVEQHETGRVTLRKFVVTEEQTVTVPVTREEIRVVHEPIGSDEAADPGGEPIGEGAVEVVLHAERPVVSVESHAVERVRLVVDEVTDEETVTREVRKEQIEVDDGSATGPGGESAPETRSDQV